MAQDADLQVKLEGALVALAPLSLAHEDGLFRAAARDREVFAWLPEDPGASRESMRRWLRVAVAAARDGREAPFAIVKAATGRPLGSTRFMEIRLEHRRVEIGWTWLERPAWGTGANVECKLLLLQHAFERVGCRRVEFKTDARNARSRGALAALPARFEGVLRKHMVLADGSARDSAYYSVVDDEWPDVRAGLERRLA
jgi:RimJ/RimL family protein N-acetyltransferase